MMMMTINTVYIALLATIKYLRSCNKLCTLHAVLLLAKAEQSGQIAQLSLSRWLSSIPPIGIDYWHSHHNGTGDNTEVKMQLA